MNWVTPSYGTGVHRRGAPVPFFFWLAFSSVSLALLMDIPVTNNLGLGVAAAVMLVGGLPHGAFDIALAQAILRLTGRAAALAFIAYVGVAASMIVLWHFIPILALALFLAFSAVHFGDDWRMLDTGLLRTMSGASVICVAAFFNSSAVAELFVAMAGPGAEWILRGLVAFAPVAILVTAVGIWQALIAGNKAWAVAHLCALVGLACFPPQLGFLVYFVFLHSPLHMRGIEQRLPKWSQVEIWIYGGIICSTSLLGTYIFAPGFFSSDAAEISSAAFRALSVVAAPHLLLSQLLERLSNPEASRPSFLSARPCPTTRVIHIPNNRHRA